MNKQNSKAQAIGLDIIDEARQAIADAAKHHAAELEALQQEPETGGKEAA